MPEYFIILFIVIGVIAFNCMRWGIKNMIEKYNKELAIEQETERWLNSGEQHGN